MKAVNIKKITKNDKKYTISLGNGTIHSRNSLKEAKKFLVLTNKFLTHRLYEINSHYGKLLDYHRQNWGYFNPQDSHESNAIISHINQSLDLAVDRSAWDNGNHFTFVHLHHCCKLLKELVRLFKKYDKKRSKNIELYLWNSTLAYIVRIQTSLKNYGTVECDSEFDFTALEQEIIFEQSYKIRLAQ